MRQVLLGKSLLGNAQGGNEGGRERFIGPPYYLINDTFTTDRAAGAVNGTDAEPGPGRRTVFDTNGKLSLTSGNLVLSAGGVGVADPDLRYGALERVAGRVLVAAAIHTASGIEIGWDSGGSGNITDCVRVVTTTLAIRAGLTATTVGAVAIATAYQYAVVQRGDLGHLYFIKGGAFSNWTLIWISAVGSSQTPNIVNLTATTAGTVSYIRVPAEKWLPTPLVSDGFSTWGTSDGLGHAEGVAGGLGVGGGGLAMTAYYGTWGAAGGVAQCSALNSGIGLAGRDVGTADMIASVKVYRSGGVAGLFVRENADDRVVAVHNGTNAQLIKRVSGVDTTLIDTAATYVAGAELRLICQGTAFRLFYGDAAIGSEQTISDTSLQAETLAGVYTTDTGNSFDDLVVYARGSGGEYAALDTVGNPLANAAWTGATWALDGSGRAYNTPTLGSELLTDGGLENWTSSTNLASWVESVAGTSTVNQETTIVQSGANAARLDVDPSGGNTGASQIVTVSAGAWIVIDWYGLSNLLGKQLRVGFAASTAGANRDPGPTWTRYIDCIRALAANPGVQMIRVFGASASSSLYFDNISAKAVSLPATFATVAGSSATQTAAARIHALTTGTQAGVVSLLDSASSPQNFLIAYHDGTNVKLDKCVAGTYTNLISTAVAFSSTALASIVPVGSNQFQLWYNGSQSGSNVTVSDAGIISNTIYGLFSTYEGNLFSEFSLDDYVVPFDLPGA